MFVFRESGCIRIKVVEFGKNWLCSCKGGCIRKKDAVFDKSCCFVVVFKVVVFGQK